LSDQENSEREDVRSGATALDGEIEAPVAVFRGSDAEKFGHDRAAARAR
jgi:hypothetical protein